MYSVHPIFRASICNLLPPSAIAGLLLFVWAPFHRGRQRSCRCYYRGWYCVLRATGYGLRAHVRVVKFQKYRHRQGIQDPSSPRCCNCNCALHPTSPLFSPLLLLAAAALLLLLLLPYLLLHTTTSNALHTVTIIKSVTGQFQIFKYFYSRP